MAILRNDFIFGANLKKCVDSSIKDSDQFQYLLQSTIEGSRAREVIDSFPPSRDNYLKVIDCLKTRFGRHDLQIEVYIRELLKLVLRNANSNFNSNNLCTLYDNLEQQIRALETLGVTTDKCACLLYPLMESCIPEDLLRAFQRGLNFDSDDDSKKRLDALLKFFKN
ncbi:integrase catalytic domain-containing protein [Trichonephila clavipes]|nr:integrase catalytic domain-containing protein [Trichonephila clavipes]